MKISQCPDCGVVTKAIATHYERRHELPKVRRHQMTTKYGGLLPLLKLAVREYPAPVLIAAGRPTVSLNRSCLECWKADRNGGNNQSAKAGPVAVASAPPRAAGLPNADRSEARQKQVNAGNVRDNATEHDNQRLAKK